MADTLKDFFVGIGFKLDTASQAKAESGAKRTEEKITKDAEKESQKRVKAEAKAAADREKQRKASAKSEDDRWKAMLAREKAADEKRAKTLKNFETAASKTASAVTGAFAAITAGAMGVVYAVDRAAKSFEKLNYTGMRSGASAGKVGAFGYAAGQLGSSKEEAEGQLQTFGQSLKLNSTGYGRALERLGIKTRDANGQLRDSVDLATDLGDALRKIEKKGPYGYANAMNQARVFGFEGDTARALMNPEFRKRAGQFGSDQSKIGADSDAAAKSGTAFEQSMRRLLEVLDQIGTKINGVLFVKLKPLLDQLSQWFLANGDKIADIVSRLADDLVKLATSIGSQLANADWDGILDKIEDLADSFGKLLGKLGGEGGLVALLGLMALRLGALGRLGMPTWLKALLGISVATDLAIPNDKKPGMIKRWDDSAGGLPGDLSGSDMDHADRRAGVRRGRRGFMSRKNADLSDGGGSNATIRNGEFRAKAPGIARRLKADFGLNDDEAAAVLGNLGHESAGFKAFNEGGNGPGRGWAQWTDPGRKARFFDYAKLNKLDPRSDEANYGFLRWELRNTHKGAIEALKKAQGLEGKTVAFEGAFEGAGVKAYGSRLRYAREAQDAMRSEPVTKVPPMLKARPIPAMPDHIKLFPGESVGADGKTVVLQPQHTSMRGDTNVTHNPTYHIAGNDVRQNMEAARLSASRGQQDLLRNVQGTLA